ncbi:unnamed protein product [Adineta ricciae]|uniref:Uncharacterized protein n=1 Tax=Adineta ricciae TaxID=249248 RepID=A0A814FAH0_ADIRI|nr:unnamed protein product [Adineta ricciae]
MDALVRKKKWDTVILDVFGKTGYPSPPPRLIQLHRPGRTIPYSDPIGSNIGFYQILQEFDGLGSRRIRNMDSLDFLRSDSNTIPFPGIRSDPASDLLTWALAITKVPVGLPHNSKFLPIPGRSFRRLDPLKSEPVPVQLFSIPAGIRCLTLTNDISPAKIDPVLTYSTPVKVDQPIIVLSPSTNYPSINDNILPFTNDSQANDMKLVCGDENVIDDESMEQYDVEDSYLENLKEEIDVLVKQLDVRMTTM